MPNNHFPNSIICLELHSKYQKTNKGTISTLTNNVDKISSNGDKTNTDHVDADLLVLLADLEQRKIVRELAKNKLMIIANDKQTLCLFG